MQIIQNNVNNLLKNVSSCADCIFNLCDAKRAVSHLKAHKNDGITGLTRYHIIIAGEDCFTHLALLFTAITVHDTAPDSFLHSTNVPILKGKDDITSNSSNFRGITQLKMLIHLHIVVT